MGRGGGGGGGDRAALNATFDSTRSNMADVSARAHFVGFANFPNQVFRRAVKNGFEFSLMVVGRSGLGKSTFLKTFLQAELTDPQDMPMDKGGQTTRITQRSMRLVENGVTLTLHLVDTPGFGDALDNTKCWEPIAQFVDDQFNAYFAEETRVERAGQLPDRRVHLCLYFIEPNGHGLKPLDVEFMRNLHTRVNLLPVIAKADCFTADELAAFKEQVLRDIQRHDLKVYDFPPTDNADEKSMSLEPLRRRFPFAVVGSTKVCEVQGHRVRVRQYPWGQCEVDNLEHNDFLALRDVLIRNSLADLVEITNDVHYENFRFRQMTRATNSGRSTPLSKMSDTWAV